jgi:hypothetical protein
VASIRQRGSSWTVEIRRLGVSLCRTFKTRKEADEWAKTEEKHIVLENERRNKKPRNADPRAEFSSAGEVVSSAVPVHNGPGVYVLIERDVITYVGRARNAIARILAHSKNGRRFTHYVIIPCEEARLALLEEKMIIRLRPAENRYLPRERPSATETRASS